MSKQTNLLADRFLMLAINDSNTMLNRLLVEISQGKQPPPTIHEWRTLKAYWTDKLNRRGVGEHNRGDLKRAIMPSLLAFKEYLRNNPTEMAAKKRDRLSLDAYVANRAHAQMTSEWNTKLARRWRTNAPPSAKRLLNWLKNYPD